MAAGYINFYVCNGAVIAPEFGDAKADRNARAALRELFPQREVVQLNIDGIAAGGGGIHCATQQQPASAACERAQPVCSGMGRQACPLSVIKILLIVVK